MSGPDFAQVEELARKVSKGDKEAFSGLVEATHATIYRLALRITGSSSDAEDAVQETYIRTWRSIHTLEDSKAAFAWICRIVRNVAYDWVRKRSRRGGISFDAPLGEGLSSLHELLEFQGKGPESVVVDKDLARCVLQVVHTLKEKHRTVLLLREVDDMSYEEMSAALGCSIGTVESRLFRARKALAEKLKKVFREVEK